jgi:hypothetical protein
MKTNVILITFFIGFFFLSVSVFASGKTEVTIHNNTKFNITSITAINLDESTMQVFLFEQPLRAKSLTVIKVKRDTWYDIYLTDQWGHRYGKEKQKWSKKTGNIIFQNKDFVHENVGDTLRHAVRSVTGK